MSKIIIGDHDRIILKNSERRVAKKDALGYVFVRMHENIELREPFTHDEIKALIDAGEMSIDVDWYEHSHATARLLAGVNNVSDLAGAELFQIRRREYYVTEFLKREAANKTIKRTDAGIGVALRDIEADRPKLKSACNRKRLDQWPPAPSARNFRRWLKTYEDRGAQTLALRMKHRQCGNRLSNLDPEMSRVLEKSALSYCSESRPTIKGVYEKMKAEVVAMNLERAERGLPEYVCPAKQTLSLRIKNLNQFEVLACREGLSAAKAAFTLVGPGLDVTRPLQHVQIDEWTIQLHTIASKLGLDDILTEEDRKHLSTERLKLCLVLDVATRCVLGFRISARSDHQTAIASMAMAVTNKNAIALAAGCRSDWPMQGPPSLVSPDAGGMFIHEDFLNALAASHIVYENAPAGLSHLRGHVERVFGTLNTGLTSFFTGRSFSNIVEKGDYKANERASIFSAQLPQIFTRYIVDIYHHTPHPGLRGETPYTAWKRLVNEFGVRASPTPHQRRERFGVELERVVNKSGILIAGNYYQSKELAAHFRQVGSTVLKIRFDASDIGHISARFGDRWNTIPSVREDVRGMDLSTWKQVVADLKARHTAGAKVYEHIVHEAVRAISALAKNAMHMTAISSDRPTKDEIDHAEASLQLGFEIVSERTSGRKPAGDILGKVFTADQHNPACATAPVTAPAESPLPSVPSAEPSADETSGSGDWPTLEIL
jgi:putative transposase